MANINITDLTAYTDPAATDVLPIVDVGADVTKKVAVGEVVGKITGDVDVATDGTSSITAGAIVNADVNASAAIAGTKIDPDFGSQTVETTGVFSAAGGSAATPSIAFTGDLNTGIYSPGADQVALSTNGTGRLTIDGSGNINVDSGGLYYDATTNRLAIGTHGGSLRIGQTSTDEPGNGNTTAGIGITAAGTGNYSATNTPGLRVNRNDSDGTAVTFLRQGNAVGTISVTTTATAYNTSSDYRLKENVTPVTDGITRLQQLKPSRFNFIADPTKTVDGFLAHEVQTIVPEAITGEKDAVDDEGNPQYQGIDQSKLVPLLTAALQEAIGRIETLEAEVAALKG